MSDTARKMFPVETVLALAVAKKGADVKDIAGYITGRSIVCDACAAAVAPFAAAWLAKLSPKFLDMNYKDGDNWGDFVNQGARLLGDTISLTPMDDCLKNAVATVLDMMDDMHGTMVSQRAEIATLRQQVETLAPYQGKAEELQKKCDKLEDTIKTMKTDMGGLRRQVAEFQGKVAINHDELMQSIKDAIKDNLKNITVGVAAAGVAGPGRRRRAGRFRFRHQRRQLRRLRLLVPSQGIAFQGASVPAGAPFFVVAQCGAKGAVPYGSPCPG